MYLSYNLYDLKFNYEYILLNLDSLDSEKDCIELYFLKKSNFENY